MSDVNTLSCFVSAFRLEDPPDDGVNPRHGWLAIATGHVLDLESPPPPGLNALAAVLAGTVLRTIDARASATTRDEAMELALKALLLKARSLGFD